MPRNPDAPHRQPNAKRPVRHDVRLTEEEEARLQELAAAANVTPVRWLVECALGDTPSQRQATNTVRNGLKTKLQSIANNVNRLTIVAESDKRTPAEFIGLLTAWRDETREVLAALRAESD